MVCAPRCRDNDLRKDAPKESVAEPVNGVGLGAVNRLMTKLAFRYMLLKRAYTRADFEHFLSQTRFGPIDIRESPLGFEVWLSRSF